MTKAFVYKWVHLPTAKYYIGSRTAAGCHLDDGYICSSKEVKPLIKNNPKEWKRTILAIGNPQDMYQLETKLLQSLDCKNDPNSFNKHNNDTRIAYPGLPKTEQHKQKLSLAKIGTKRGPCSDERKKKISLANKGKSNMTEQQRQAVISANKLYKRHTVPHTEQAKDKMKKTLASKPTLVCSKCNFKSKNIGPMYRWHFDNCKK